MPEKGDKRLADGLEADGVASSGRVMTLYSELLQRSDRAIILTVHHHSI